MITSPRTPPLLAPYVVLPQPGSLTLVTGVLGATPNWLVLRFLAVALVDLGPDDRCKAHVHPAGDGWDQGEDEVRIVLVSFSKDWAFWKGEGVRTVRCESPLSLHAFLGEGVQLVRPEFDAGNLSSTTSSFYMNTLRDGKGSKSRDYKMT